MRTLVLIVALALATASGQPVVISRAKLYAHPASDPYDCNNRYGFNHAPNVIVLPDGRLFAAWFSGPFEASVSQVILGAYSSDQGRTWTRAEVIQDFPRKSDFDPALISDGKRTWLFFSAGRWNRYPFLMDEKNQVGAGSFQIFYRMFGGSGWSAPVAAPIEPGFDCRNNGIRLSTGELLLPVYQLGGHQTGVLKSSNAGRTWRRFGRIATPAGEDEPTIAEMRSGAVLMFLRTGGGYLWKTISRDRGETWPAAEKTEITAAASSHSLFRLRDGRLVLTHDASPKHRTPLTLRISPDDAASWGPPLVLAEVPVPTASSPARQQVSYPSVAQLADETLVVVWARISISDTEQYGDIEAARVRIR